ncbi:MAG: AI-2E family transporter [Gammaproteobacteria bacterium]
MSDSQKWLLLAAVAATGWMIYLLAPILTPFVFGGLLAYLGDPLADRLETWRLSRSAAVSLVFLVMILILATVLLLLVPLLEHQVSRLIANLPHYVEWLKGILIPWISERFGLQPKTPEVEEIVAMIRSHWSQAGGFVASLAGSVSRSGRVVAEGVMNLVLIPVVAFYLLRDWDILVAKVRDLLPIRIEPTISRLARESDAVLGAFLKGQFSVMIALGVIYSLGLRFIGLDVALLIGMLAGLVSFIPYLGSIVGVVSACFAAIVQFHDVWSVVPVFVVFAVGQTLEGMLLTPWLVGDKVGLHPVAVIFSVLAGGQLFGFVGILLALPVASVIMVLLRHVHDLYKDSDLYGIRAAPSVESPQNGPPAE